MSVSVPTQEQDLNLDSKHKSVTAKLYMLLAVKPMSGHNTPASAAEMCRCPAEPASLTRAL